MKSPDPLLRIRDAELQDWVDAVNFILNAGKYEFAITTSVPTHRANSGEQFVYTASDGTTDRRFYVYIGNQWCRIDFDADGNAGSGFTDHIIDSDGDTLVHTQFVQGENLIRTYSKGVYVTAVDTYGFQIAPMYKMVFDGLGGTTYWTYSSASSYMQCYLNGSLRMEM